jgi:hypothetical protein
VRSAGSLVSELDRAKRRIDLQAKMEQISTELVGIQPIRIENSGA